MVRLGEAAPKVWDDVLAEMERKLQDIEFKASEVSPDWRKLAHERKFDREIFLRYGYFKDIILHPRFQQAKQIYEEYVDFSFFMGHALLPFSTAVIILFMMNRRVSNSVLGLTAAFLFNVNPFYVCLAVLALWFRGARKYVPRQYVPTRQRKAEEATEAQTIFDHVLVGSDFSTLYVAALLSRCGHRCCVLQPECADAIEFASEDAPCPVPLTNAAVSKVERYQMLLDVALGRQQPATGRVTFAPLGRSDDGFTSAVLRLRAGKGANQLSKLLTWRVGEKQMVAELQAKLGVEKQGIENLWTAVNARLPQLSAHLASKFVPSAAWQTTSVGKTEIVKQFKTFVGSSAGQLLFSHEIGKAESIDDLAALASAMTDKEIISSSELSSLSLAQALQCAEGGVFVPVGGALALRDALKEVVLAAGGKVLKDADVKGLVLEEYTQESSKRFKAVGVALGSGSVDEDVTVSARRSVISGMGLLCTLLTMLPADSLRSETLGQLRLLKEARPRVRALFWLRGDQLKISSSEFYELSSQRLAALQHVSGDIHDEELVRVWSPSAQDVTWKQRQGADLHVVIVEMTLHEPIVSSIAMRRADNAAEGPWLYRSYRDSSSDVNHFDWAQAIGRRLQLSPNKRDELLRKAELLLCAAYPTCKDHVIHRDLSLPWLGGHQLANTTAKHSCALGAQTDVEGLYLTGQDLAGSGLMGDFQAGWITANAVLGYGASDIENHRNIIVDLQNV